MVCSRAKRLAAERLKRNEEIGKTTRGTRTTVAKTIWRKCNKENIPKGVGTYTTEMDVATPGEHTKLIYDALNKKEAAIIAQLRTDIARINQYLHRIGAAESAKCECGAPIESVRHYLFLCPRWSTQRSSYRSKIGEKFADLSYCLGGKSREVRYRGKPWDGARWKPCIEAVRATIHFVKAIKRLATTAEGSLEPANPPGLPNTI